jgi:hypothetical protein
MVEEFRIESLKFRMLLPSIYCIYFIRTRLATAWAVCGSKPGTGSTCIYHTRSDDSGAFCKMDTWSGGRGGKQHGRGANHLHLASRLKKE